MRKTKSNGMRLVQLPPSLTIVLPKHLFKPADRVMLLTTGNALLITKVESSRAFSPAYRSASRPMSTRHVLREIRAHRRTKRR